MLNKQIFFTDVHKAELVENNLRGVRENEVLTRTEYTVVSGGTERACILGMNNTSQNFPMSLGYCGVGYVEEVGAKVTSVAAGDRVLVYHGCHSKYNIRPESDITKVENDAVSSLEAAFVIIASMGLGGVRKLEIELGESAMVMGQGLLGIFATQFLRLSGANPVIAVDLSAERRELALKLGADCAFDPSDDNFVRKVKEATKGKGVNGCVEVTGVSAAMKQALECASWMGRIALLGCTRVSDCSVDYYQQVHTSLYCVSARTPRSCPVHTIPTAMNKAKHRLSVRTNHVFFFIARSSFIHPYYRLQFQYIVLKNIKQHRYCAVFYNYCY